MKCTQYWPEKEGQTKWYGEIQVDFLREQNCGSYILRMFSLKHEVKTSRITKVYHMQTNFYGSEHICEIEMQTFPACLAVTQLGEALQQKWMSLNFFVLGDSVGLLKSNRQARAFIQECSWAYPWMYRLWRKLV